MISYTTPGGAITLDANLDDWHEVSALKVHASNAYFWGIQNIALYATTSDTHFVFALDAGAYFGGPENYTASLLFDADLDTATGSSFFGGLNESLIKVPGQRYKLADGIDFELRFVDRVPKLFTGGTAQRWTRTFSIPGTRTSSNSRSSAPPSANRRKPCAFSS